MTASEMRNRISERDRAILHQACEDMVTPEFVWNRHFAGQTIAAAQSGIRRLCAASLLYSLPLAERRRYYRLTRHGAGAIQVHARHTRPLKRQGLVERFALAWFFHVQELNRAYRFDPSEWADEFPQFKNRRYWRRPFFIREDASGAQFGVVLVDHSGSRRRWFSKTTELVAELIRSGWLDPRHAERRLTLTMLTFSDGRAQSLRQLLGEHLAGHLRRPNVELPVTLEAFCVQDLRTLLPLSLK